MANYRMFIILGGQQLEVPVLPAELSVGSGSRNETAVVLKLGQINILRGLALRTIKWKSFLPAHNAPYVTGGLPNPAEWIRAIQAARDNEQSGRFLITGTDLDINMACAVESLDYSEKGGEVGDVYYTITLKEWKSYSASRVSVSSGSVKKAHPVRAGKPAEATAKTYPVKAGDSLWAIAQKVYGDGSKYPQLYEKNKALIDSRNKGTGNPKYTIYPGQEFKI